MNFLKIISTIIITLSVYNFSPILTHVYGAEKITFAVINLGGPDTGQEGDKIITQFMSSLAKLSGLTKDSLQGKYFNNIDDAIMYIKQNKNSYIMGSIGFYLANRKNMNLSPLAVVRIQGNDKEKYYLIIKKGSFKSLKEMKGKTCTGNILYENKKFINTLIFNNSIDITEYFKLKPSNRPLSAVRKLTKGEYDAILVNHLQYNSLKNLPVFKDLQIIHESSPMPAVGLMMINTEKNKSVKTKIVNAITKMCSQDDAKEACKNFGIEGFQKLESESLDNEISKYEKNSK